MVMPKRPPTRNVRVRISDANKLKELAKRANKSLPEYINQLLK